MIPTKDEIIDLVWHSNRIDYNTINPKYLTREIVKSVFDRTWPEWNTEPHEILQHLNAVEQMIELSSQDNILLTDVATQLHKTLMTDILLRPGQFRTEKVWIGGNEAPSFYQVPILMARFNNMLPHAKTEQDAWDIHDEFEMIHPFIDCNGRVGRLLLNFVRLKLGFPIHIVTYGEEGTQYKYYRKIQQYRETKFKEIKYEF